MSEIRTEPQLVVTDSDESIYRRQSETEALNKHGFKLMKELGEGAFSRVFLSVYQFPSSATDKKSVFLACKVINTKKTATVYTRKFLQRELDILRSCSHPNIIFVHSIFTRNNKYFIFMRYAERGDLFEYLLSNGALTEEQCAVWVRQLSSAIQYLHKLEVAHRDLKCENVLITKNFNAKLSDFGFVRSCIDDITFKVQLSNTFCGSLTYVSPEIIKGSPYEPKISDMWSFGVLIYIMLNKAHPFSSTHLQSLYQNQIQRNWKFTCKKIDSVSQGAKELISNLIEPDTKKRWTIDNVLDCDWMKLMLNNATALTEDERKALDSAIAHINRVKSNPSAGSLGNSPTKSSTSIAINNKEFKRYPFNKSKTNEAVTNLKHNVAATPTNIENKI